MLGRKVGGGRSENPRRGPLLIISGEKDNTVSWAIANASFKTQQRNEAVTEIVEIPGRGHALTIDNGWRKVADTALTFVKRFAPSTKANSRAPSPSAKRTRPVGRSVVLVVQLDRSRVSDDVVRDSWNVAAAASPDGTGRARRHG